jgi:hypothetical protein
MPNWCDNMLTVEGEQEKLQEFKKKAEFHGKVEVTSGGEDYQYDTDLSLGNFLPLPKELVGTTAPSREKNEELIKKYGADNWYDWQVMNWGVKWDVNATLSSEDENVLKYWFDSAWCPPLEWLRAVGKLYPELEFTLDYEESGCQFEGTMYAHGDEFWDEEREYSKVWCDECQEEVEKNLATYDEERGWVCDDCFENLNEGEEENGDSNN